MSTDQSTLFGFIGYQFTRSSTSTAARPESGAAERCTDRTRSAGQRSGQADEFFRGAFTNGVWANGEVAPGLWYSVAVGNNFSTLGITAKQLNRNLATGGRFWWMPTTHEFGPSGSLRRLGVPRTRGDAIRFLHGAEP
jgi:hypothetical protein